MIKSITRTGLFKRLEAEERQLGHAYLFYSKDRILNDELAMLFAMKIFCQNHKPCFECEPCQKMLFNKNPDFVVVDKPNILVEDISKILEEALLKPMIYSYKIVLIKNAENISEIAQNKLLKTLEEPNASTLFILTTTNEEKLLSTVKSRVKKVFLYLNDISILKEELQEMGVSDKFINKEFSLTEMLENSNSKEYLSYLGSVESLFTNLKNSQDIPEAVTNLKISSQNKFIYIQLIEKLFKALKTENSIFNSVLIDIMRATYSKGLIVKVQLLIEDAYKKLKSNVNANYVFDNLLYNILKEKYLCKQ